MSRGEKYIKLTIEFQKEDDVWTAECLELGTATFGDTFEEAQEAIRECVTLHLNTLEDIGDCDRYLKEHKVKIYNKQPDIKKRVKKAIPFGSVTEPIIQPIGGYCFE